jgi:hypothetical protein
MKRHLLPAAVFATLFAAALPAFAQSVCSSDGQAQPRGVLERFINADCEDCWRDPATPKAQAGEVALDWIVPGGKGEDAPLSMAASRDALARLQALHRSAPAQADSVRAARKPSKQRLRIAQGETFNDYIGTSIELKGGATRGQQAWLLLVEQLPAGTEGSPVARNLVRNSFQPPWDERSRGRLYEARPMWIPPGTHRDRLRLVALLYDARGRLVAGSVSHCGSE